MKITENKKINGATVLFVVCFFAYMMSYISRLPFSALINSMDADGVLAKNLAGTVSTAYMLCYGSGQLIFGRLSSKMSPAIFMGVGLICAGLANIGMALSSSYVFFIVFWSLCGIFNSMLWPSLTRAFAEWLPEKERYNAGVNVSPTIPLGSAASLLVCSALLKYVENWRMCFVACGGLVIFAGIVTLLGFFSIRSYVAERRAEFNRTLADATADGKPGFPIKVFFTSLACMVILAAMFNGTLRDSVTAWVPTVVSDVFSKDASFAAMISVIVPLSSILGSFIAKAIDKRLRSEMKTTALLFSVCAVCAILLYLLNDTNVYVSIFLISVSITATLGVNTMIVVLYPMRFANIGASGAVTGFLNSTCCLTAGLGSTLYGLAGVSLGWRNVFLIWACLGVSAVVTSLVGAKASDKIRY